MAPIKKIQSRTKYASYISENTKKMMISRNLIFQLASSSGKLEDWNNYKTIRNRVTNALKKEKYQWQKFRMDNLSYDTSSIWKHMKRFLGWNSGGPPNRLMHDGKLYSKPAELSKIMNSFFVS